MTSFRPSSFRPWQSAFLFLLLCSLSSASAGSLRTVERKIPSYSQGMRTYTCLVIDGGVVPLFVPADAKLEREGDLKLVWPADRTSATIRAASPEEVALLDAMDKPEGSAQWEKYLAATLGAAADQYTVRDFQPGTLAVNHWRIGVMVLDYSLAGMRSCALLLLWRCQDGSTLAVTMRTGFSDFNARRDQLYGMIGGAMLLPE
jgi:hypothetical protein